MIKTALTIGPPRCLLCVATFWILASCVTVVADSSFRHGTPLRRLSVSATINIAQSGGSDPVPRYSRLTHSRPWGVHKSATRRAGTGDDSLEARDTSIQNNLGWRGGGVGASGRRPGGIYSSKYYYNKKRRRQGRGNNLWNGLDQTAGHVISIVTSTGQMLIPPAVQFVRSIVALYQWLPTDMIVAQIGLVYCFAGGYYPTLFAAIQAARHCGWEIMCQAILDLTDEAVAAIDALNVAEENLDQEEPKTARQVILEKTRIVLITVDPMKINQATAALYTTWMGVSAVLEREFARTIALAVSIGGYVTPIAKFVLGRPLYFVIPSDYHRWVPVLVGWSCKGIAMSIAWKIQRVLTAYTSAVTGGLMFTRACSRMLYRRGIRLFGLISPLDQPAAAGPTGSVRPSENINVYSPLEEIFGIMIAGFGLYSQIGHGFAFRVPFPLSLVTWPFGLAERWIQWQITKMDKK
jgi:hypothetical protein